MAESIQHDGVVVAIDERVRVKIIQSDACSACRAKSMCMSAESRESILDCTATDSLRKTLSPGDKVTISISQRMGWKAVLLAYILPFVILIGVLACLDVSFANEAVAGLSALVAVGGYYLILRCLRDKISREFECKIVNKIN